MYSDSEYAAFVEFGTGPAKEKMDPSKGTLEDTIRRWALIKLPSAPLSEIDRLVNKVVKKVRVEGISPQPFLRSAVNTEMDMECGDNSTYMDDPHHSLLSMCEDIQILAEDNLTNNGTVATGALVYSIEAEHIDPGLYNINYATGEVTLVVPDPNIPEIEDIWDDPKKGIKVKGVHKEAKKRR